jgi:hypothetical protein
MYEQRWTGVSSCWEGNDMSEPAYKLIAELRRELSPPAEGILSRTLYAHDRLKVVGFGFAAGEELSEHTARRRP